MIDRVLDRLADLDTRRKMLVFYTVFCILPAGLLLYVLNLFPSSRVLPLAGLYLAFLIIIQFPVCGLLSNLLVLRNLSKFNAYCQAVKQGKYRGAFDLPPEKGNENDFIRAKRNLYWMGEVIASREKKLVDSMKELTVARQEVMASIQYASRIQHTLLPPESALKEAFRDHFVWWEPRDVVGGDTYCVHPVRNGMLVAAIDCTGHGVPGAFMTLIVHALLEPCLQTDYGEDPAMVLACMNRRLRAFLHHNTHPNPVDDGFEAAFCHINTERNRMIFAGAGLPLYYESEGEILVIKGDRAGVGDRRVPEDACYTNHVLDLRETTRFYLATDGLVDQIGGPAGMPFGGKRLKGLLGRLCHMPFAEQKKELSAAWSSYTGHEDRRDDLTVLGISTGPFQGVPVHKPGSGH